MSRTLPSDASLEFDRKQARRLLAAARDGDTDALARFAAAGVGVSDASLNDAQLVIAREYGLPSWRALVEKIESLELSRFAAALRKGDVDGARRLLRTCESLRWRINDPLFEFGRRPVHLASSNPTLMDVLIEFGADINLRSDWENGPFTVLDDCTEPAARELIARGARLTVHAAARLGWMDELQRLLEEDPARVHEKGGDGQRPLHFAKTPEIADLLLDRGAEIDARCVDHHSTAAQYALVDRPDVARRLLERGASADIFMPARLGNAHLANRLIDADPSCLAARINAPGHAMVPQGAIYCWTLGWYLSPHEVAIRFGHKDVYDLLCDRSTAKVRLLVACSRADAETARSILRERPGLIAEFTAADQALMPFSMFYGRPDAVKLMLSLGFDPSIAGIDGGTLLHIAAWMGEIEIVRALLQDHRARIDLEARDSTHGSTPLGWAAHGSVHSPAKNRGSHAEVVSALVAAGAAVDSPANKYGTSLIDQCRGNNPLQELLRKLGAK